MTILPPQPQDAGWRIFQGNGAVHGDWTVPEPPRWRPRRASEQQARVAAPRPALSAAARIRGAAYQANDDIVTMVNAALHLRRPLLVTGAPGTGKSTLVDAIAYELDLGEPLRWAVTSRSTVHDAQYSYDAIGRLQTGENDRDNREHLDIGDFIQLGPLGTAMLPTLRPRVLLIDEIDKADIDLPNDLLNVLDEGRFTITELGRTRQETVAVQRFDGGKVAITNGVVECYEFPLVVLTSNGERDFSAPFLRRCLQLRMPDPLTDRARLESIVTAHLGIDKTRRSDTLIGTFMARAQKGEVLATDQLLNAIQMVMGSYAMDGADRDRLVHSLTVGLGQKS
jgi:MoxR-like ATPase